MTMTATKEKPIMFLDQMVRAILDDLKTMTRREVKAPNIWAIPKSDGRILYDLNRAWKDGRPDDGYGEYLHVPFAHPGEGWQKNPMDDTFERVYPRFSPGDRAFVREGVKCLDTAGLTRGKNGGWNWPDFGGGSHASAWFNSRCYYTATATDTEDGVTLNKMFMPQWASRIKLEFTAVKVERLCSISEEDAKAEGADAKPCERKEDFVRHYLGHANGYGVETKFVNGFRWIWETINGKGSWAANPWVWCYSFKRV